MFQVRRKLFVDVIELFKCDFTSAQNCELKAIKNENLIFLTDWYAAPKLRICYSHVYTSEESTSIFNI